jgi:hypothetical protein
VSHVLPVSQACSIITLEPVSLEKKILVAESRLDTRVFQRVEPSDCREVSIDISWMLRTLAYVVVHIRSAMQIDTSIVSPL